MLKSETNKDQKEGSKQYTSRKPIEFDSKRQMNRFKSEDAAHRSMSKKRSNSNKKKKNNKKNPFD